MLTVKEVRKILSQQGLDVVAIIKLNGDDEIIVSMTKSAVYTALQGQDGKTLTSWVYTPNANMNQLVIG